MWQRVNASTLTRETIAGTATLVCGQAGAGWVIQIAGRGYAAGTSFVEAERVLRAAIVELRQLRAAGGQS